MKPTRDVKAISDAWRRLAQTTHPDKGGSAEQFQEARDAYNQALVLAPTLVEIRRPNKNLSFRLFLKASTVVNASTEMVEFYDHTGRLVSCTVNIPAWHLQWGANQTLRVVNIEATDGTLINLDISCCIQNDSLTINKEGLLLEPEVTAASAIGQDSISFDWNGAMYKINIDKYGCGLLYSQGYLLEDGSRSNILVKPKYVFN